MAEERLMLQTHLHGLSRVFLDTAPIIYYVEKNKRYLPTMEDFFAYLDEGQITAVTSPVTLAECLVAPLRRNDPHTAHLFTQLIVHRALFQLIDQTIAEVAADLRAQYGLNLLDAFQVAAALSANCDGFLTNDKFLTRITECRVLVLDEIIIDEEE